MRGVGLRPNDNEIVVPYVEPPDADAFGYKRVFPGPIVNEHHVGVAATFRRCGLITVHNRRHGAACLNFCPHNQREPSPTNAQKRLRTADGGIDCACPLASRIGCDDLPPDPPPTRKS